MKYSKLEGLVFDAIGEILERDRNNSYHSGDEEKLETALEEAKRAMILKYDLRPSEFSKIPDLEVPYSEDYNYLIDRENLKILDASFIKVEDREPPEGVVILSLDPAGTKRMSVWNLSTKVFDCQESTSSSEGWKWLLI